MGSRLEVPWQYNSVVHGDIALLRVAESFWAHVLQETGDADSK